MTAGPVVGPASAYPTFRRPASICFSGPNEAFVPGLIVGRSAGFVLLDWAFAEPIMPNWAAAMVMLAVLKKRRRSWLISLDICISYRIQIDVRRVAREWGQTLCPYSTLSFLEKRACALGEWFTSGPPICHAALD